MMRMLAGFIACCLLLFCSVARSQTTPAGKDGDKPATGNVVAITPASSLLTELPNAQKALDAVRKTTNQLDSATVKDLTAVPAGQRDDVLAGYRKDLHDALKECGGLLADYDSKQKQSFFTSFGLSIIGAIAGSIVAPALTATGAEAHRAAIAAASGLSGVMNTAQRTYDDSDLSAAKIRDQRDQIRKDVKQALGEFFKAGSDLQKRGDAILSVKAACLGYVLIDKGAIKDQD